ncbi:MAG: hypothetical protein M1827_001716 [Pycnora praestabilis]|nr:MAG: hypothetical protein M1827_001716 [Pycnora praestabilis]
MFGRAIKMNGNGRISTSPFTKAVVNSMRKLYPEALADKSFDNTGLFQPRNGLFTGDEVLLEAPFDPIRRQMNSVLLTIDLTKAVVDEAIERQDSVIVSYHPIIFRGLKALTLADTQQQSLLRLAQEGISVYCPHTAVDAAPGGLGDWLADIVTGTFTDPDLPTDTEASTPEPKTPDSNSDPFITVPMDVGKNGEQPQEVEIAEPVDDDRPMHSEPTHPEPTKLKRDHANSSSHERSVITPIKGVPGFEDAGMGRVVRFKSPERLTNIIERIGRGMGNPPAFPIAIPQGKQIDEIEISSVGICAGSGGSLFKDLDVDLLFTGELSHHEALTAIEQNRVVISLFHSNTERGYLRQILQDKLHATLVTEWSRLRSELLNRHVPKKIGRNVGEEEGEGWEDILRDEGVFVEVSERDRDPFGIVIARGRT